MAFFTYTAVDREGTLVKGFFEGPDIETAKDTVSSSGLYVVAVKRSGRYGEYLRRLAVSRRVGRAEIIEFSKNLSVMLRAGVPMLKGLSDMAGGLDNRYFQQTVNGMRRKIEFGGGFSESAAEYPLVFPEIFIRLTMVGEETGNLDKSLSDAAAHLEKMEDLASSIKRALIYPAFAVTATFGALLFWLVYVLPKVMEIFTDMRLELPLPTRILLYASGFSKEHWYLALIAPVALFYALKLLRRHRKVLYHTDRLVLKLPVVRHVACNMLLALFAEQMRILTVAGITVDRSLKIVSEVIKNEVFRVAIGKIREEIALGSRISEAVGKQKVFPTVVRRMVEIGETSGSLDEQFGYLAEHYLKTLDGVSQKIGKMVEPIVIGVIGMMFALIIMGLMLPVYDLVARIGG